MSTSSNGLGILEDLPRRELFDVLQVVQGKPRLVGILVGILTSSEAAKDRHGVALIGAERYIHKPSTVEEFEDVGQAVRGDAAPALETYE